MGRGLQELSTEHELHGWARHVGKAALRLALAILAQAACDWRAAREGRLSNEHRRFLELAGFGDAREELREFFLGGWCEFLADSLACERWELERCYKHGMFAGLKAVQRRCSWGLVKGEYLDYLALLRVLEIE